MKVIAQLGQKLADKDLGALLDALNHTAIVSMTDVQGRITYANEKFVEISQYPLGELLGKNHRILKSGDQPDALFVDLWRTVANGSVWRGEIKNRAKDGSFYWVDTAIAPILNHRGTPERYISVRFLITDRKRAEMFRSQFVSLASHQLRTPLSIMRSALSSLRMGIGGTLSGGDAEDFQSAERAAITMAETIDTLVRLSQLQAGKIGLHVTHIQLDALFKSLALDFQQQSGAKRQRLTCTCPQGLSVDTDERLLQEILHNLLSNAIKYSAAEMDIHLRAMQQGGDVRIDVEDAGMGIPAHEQERVFSMFFRGENAVDREIAGTGLGLHLVHSLTQLLTGDISFTSTLGRGTTFSLLLPMKLEKPC